MSGQQTQAQEQEPGVEYHKYERPNENEEDKYKRPNEDEEDKYERPNENEDFDDVRNENINRTDAGYDIAASYLTALEAMKCFCCHKMHNALIFYLPSELWYAIKIKLRVS